LLSFLGHANREAKFKAAAAQRLFDDTAGGDWLL
jgi:hypothetical protein